MKYIVTEIQTFDTGAIATPAYSYDERSAAERQFHLLTAGAVVSALPTHAVVLGTNEGQIIERKVYHHAPVQPEEPVEEPTEEETPSEEVTPE